LKGGEPTRTKKPDFPDEERVKSNTEFNPTNQDEYEGPPGTLKK
jgi:hypothetical protein